MAEDIYCTSEELAAFAFESGRELTLRPTHAELTINGRLFKAPLPLPKQREAGAES